jgi:hypothetical protein
MRNFLPFVTTLRLALFCELGAVLRLLKKGLWGALPPTLLPSWPSPLEVLAAGPTCRRFGSSLTHLQITAAQVRSVKRRDSCLGFGPIRHVDVGKATTLTRCAISGEGDHVDCAVFEKEGPEVLLSGT